MNANEVNATLESWGNRIFNSGPVKKRIRKGLTGLRLLASHSTMSGAGGGRMDASAVRRKVGALVKRRPQVMVRISGGGKGMRHIKAHLDYISRHGQIPLEDQNGDRLHGKEDVNAVRDEWRFGGFAIDDSATSRQAFNIILSMPAGTSDVALLRAARDFATSEFVDHQYVMALHTQDTDPDPDPSPNPHVHLCVKATGLDGTRLNPRKADLHRWREAFAERLRENGVECDATMRAQRLQPKRGEKQSVRHKKARDENFDRIRKGAPNRERVEKARQVESHLLGGFHALAHALANSDREDDRKLGLDLASHTIDTARRNSRDREGSRER